MSHKRSTRFRPSAFDHLEDRAVPSSGMSRAQVSAAATRSTGSGTGTTTAAQMQLQTALLTAGTQINAAYATFASSARQAEATLLNPTSPVPTSTVVSQVGTLINTLSASVTTALNAVPRVSADTAVIASGFTGGSSGSLLSRMTTLFNAASVNGTVTQANLPILFTAVEGAISGSYASTSLDGYLAAVGRSRASKTATPATSTVFSASTFGTQINAAYATFANVVRQAEATLAGTASTNVGTVSNIPINALGTASTSIQTALVMLSQSVTAGLAGTTAANYSTLVQDQFTGLTPGSLASQLTGLLNALAYQSAQPASGGGTTTNAGQAQLNSELALIYATVESAITASYNSTAIQGYLIGNVVAPVMTTTGGSPSIGSSNSASGSGATTGSGTGTTTTTGGSTNPGGTSSGVNIPVTTAGGNSGSTPGVGGLTGTTTGTGTGTGTPVGLPTSPGGTTTGTGTTGTGTTIGTGTGTIGTGTGTGTIGTGTGIGTIGTGTGTTIGKGTGTTIGTGTGTTTGTGTGAGTTTGIGTSTGTITGIGTTTGTGTSTGTSTGVGTTTGVGGVGTII